ncbi:MAG: hypothetical protein KY463_04000 [Actinobacteria bacterium]|nr:hypothetical protein [Actinomycetota bacterium]
MHRSRRFRAGTPSVQFRTPPCTSTTGTQDESLEPFGCDEWLAELDDQQLAALLRGEGAESTIKVVRRDKVVMSEKK